MFKLNHNEEERFFYVYLKQVILKIKHGVSIYVRYKNILETQYIVYEAKCPFILLNFVIILPTVINSNITVTIRKRIKPYF